MKVLRPAEWLAQVQADFEELRGAVETCLSDSFGISSREHAADIAATAAMVLPSLAADVVMLRRGGKIEEADALVLRSLQALQSQDAILFESCTREEYIDVAIRFGRHPAVARGEAERAGVEERRRDSYPMKHRLRQTPVSDDEVRERVSRLRGQYRRVNFIAGGPRFSDLIEDPTHVE